MGAEDPYFIYLFFELLHFVPNFRVLQVKNKYKASKIESSGSPSVLIKIEVELPDRKKMICEVQLYVDSFLSLKKCQHKTYELSRVDPFDYINLIVPIFDNIPRADAGANKAQAIAEAKEYFNEVKCQISRQDNRRHVVLKKKNGGKDVKVEAKLSMEIEMSHLDSVG